MTSGLGDLSRDLSAMLEKDRRTWDRDDRGVVDRMDLGAIIVDDDLRVTSVDDWWWWCLCLLLRGEGGSLIGSKSSSTERMLRFANMPCSLTLAMSSSLTDNLSSLSLLCLRVRSLSKCSDTASSVFTSDITSEADDTGLSMSVTRKSREGLLVCCADVVFDESLLSVFTWFFFDFSVLMLLSKALMSKTFTAEKNRYTLKIKTSKWASYVHSTYITNYLCQHTAVIAYISKVI